MSAPGGGYQMESQEARALRSINTESYDYRDQAKLLTKLTGDVSYMAGYMRSMQRGIDDANKNFIQQIQDLINELLTIIGGGGDTGFDWGDLKYVFQAIGALFGFDSATGIASLFPINLFSAAWHFFSTYIIPLDNLGEFIDWIIDQFIATILDIFGDIPIVGQALQQFFVWVTQFRDMLNAFTEMFGAWTKPIVDFIYDTVSILWEIFVAWTEPIATFIVNTVTFLWGIFGTWTQYIAEWVLWTLDFLSGLFSAWTEPIVQWITDSLNFLTGLFGEWSVTFTNWLTETVDWLYNTFFAWTEPIATWVRETLAFLFGLFEDWTAPFVAVIGQVVDAVQEIVDWFVGGVGTAISQLFPWAKKLPQMQIVQGQEVIKTANVPPLDTSKFTTGQLPPERIGDLPTSIIKTGQFTGTFIADGAIGTNKIGDFAVNGNKLGDQAVSTNKLGDQAVATGKLAGFAVTNEKVSGLDGTKVNSGTIGIGVIPTTAIGQTILPKISSGAIMSRRSTTNMGATGTSAIFSNFFTQLDTPGTEFGVNVATSTFTAPYSGWFIVEIGFRINPSAAFGFNAAPAIFKNGTIHKVGSDGIQTATRMNMFAQSCFVVQLNAGQFVQAGYRAEGAAAALFDADSSGTETYFSIATLSKIL